MTIAVEPKITLPGCGMIGLENTFLVSSSGGICLTGGGHETAGDFIYVER
jgi:Xaa-Pro aminopeptidase